MFFDTKGKHDVTSCKAKFIIVAGWALDYQSFRIYMVLLTHPISQSHHLSFSQSFLTTFSSKFHHL